ncbi:MAG: NAD-dependent epimerase/dehydratase family protein [Lachnospiraceae bacterium]|nr:NAD-dependent epimerase/dehydratase family protein [Lachnospiraceae bacterium]MDE7436076.1 NAD-dependent epimerase/dehydratase family protein [Lachnospiraceae bacterium]
MPKVLVTGGTVFVSRYVAEYYVKRGYEVYVMNRGSRPQPEGTTLIQADRHNLGDKLKGYEFDAVLDITAYTAEDIAGLCDALGNVGQYIMISSSAVYPETLPQPFVEGAQTGANAFWGAYGTNKIAAEEELLARMPEAYILRPPYLYGPWNNVYREAFVFDCAMAGRKFYLPGDGEMKLQFFHVEDLCRFMDCIMEQRPKTHIFNVGNPDSITVREWVQLCYQAAGVECVTVPVHRDEEQRNYFSFHNYEYCLDVSGQQTLMPVTKSLMQGLRESYAWYREHTGEVNRKPYMEYIDEHFHD